MFMRDKGLLLQMLLSCPDVVLPLLAKMHPIDHAVDRVVTDVGMYTLDHKMKVYGRPRKPLGVKPIRSSFRAYSSSVSIN